MKIFWVIYSMIIDWVSIVVNKFLTLINIGYSPDQIKEF